MAVKKEYLEFVLDWLSPLGAITARPMMGGVVVYCDAVLFALVARNTFYLKVDGVTRPRFEALGLLPFRPFPDRPGTMPYYPPPAEFFENPEDMAEWGRAAIEAGRRAKGKRKGRSRH